MRKLDDGGSESEMSERENYNEDFIQRLIKTIRLPLISVKNLVTEVKLSGYFDDSHIFEGIQFKVAPEILSKELVEQQERF